MSEATGPLGPATRRGLEGRAPDHVHESLGEGVGTRLPDPGDLKAHGSGRSVPTGPGSSPKGRSSLPVLEALRRPLPASCKPRGVPHLGLPAQLPGPGLQLPSHRGDLGGSIAPLKATGGAVLAHVWMPETASSRGGDTLLQLGWELRGPWRDDATGPWPDSVDLVYLQLTFELSADIASARPSVTVTVCWYTAVAPAGMA